jgi:ABC-type uncharacterized transport system substrate-binding protein
LIGGLLAAPLAAEAQQTGKVYRIGVVAAGVNPRSASFFQAFEQRLRELGWVEGKNLVVEFQTPKGSRDLSSIAASFVRQNVDVIIAGGPEASLKAARQATSTIPIVMVALNTILDTETGRYYSGATGRPHRPQGMSCSIVVALSGFTCYFPSSAVPTFGVPLTEVR